MSRFSDLFAPKVETPAPAPKAEPAPKVSRKPASKPVAPAPVVETEE